MSEEIQIDNAADAKRVEKKAKKAESVRDGEIRDIQKILGMREGRRFFWRYLHSCRIYESSFSDDSHRMAFKEGERNVGLKLMADITEASPDALILMMKENKERKE